MMRFLPSLKLKVRLDLILGTTTVQEIESTRGPRSVPLSALSSLGRKASWKHYLQ